MKFTLAIFLLCITALLNATTPGSGKPQQLQSVDETPQGLKKSDWKSICAAYDAGQHSFQPIDGGWQARNPGQQWTTKFDQRGFLTTPKGGDWSWGLEMVRGEDTPDKPGVLTADKEGRPVLSYLRSAYVTEWFINDKRGLEQGWTLSAPAEIRLLVRGGMKPVVSRQSISFGGKLTYAGLKAWDATGKTVPSHFEESEGGVAVCYDDNSAQYPITIDPIAQQAYLKPTAASLGTANAGDWFGVSVAISGDTVVVGAMLEDSSTTGINSTPNETAISAGAAYVFVRSGDSWIQQAYLKAMQVTSGDFFGSSVAVSGDTVVIGATGEDSSSSGINSTSNEGAREAGATYVFVRSGSNWTQQAYLKAAQVTPFDNFGASVAVSGDTLVVGASEEDSSTTGINSNPNESAVSAGAAYVFVRSGSTWTQQAYLKASQVTTGDLFGYSVAVNGDTVVVGASGESSSTTGINSTPNESASRSGAAYVFVRNSGTWTQQAYLKATQVTKDDVFGNSVAVSGDTVVVGAIQEDSSTTGINSTPNESASVAGAAYVFVRSGSTWTQQAYLKAAQVTAGDQFGYSVAISGNRVVVGANAEDSSSTGSNSMHNENAVSAGAAYVFARSGGTWTQQAYLKAAQVTAGDQFGVTVAVSGDTVVVGATNEDSSTTGINSTPNESASAAGAAYIFTEIASADLSILVSGAPETAQKGSDVTYTLTMTNNGPSDVVNPAVSFPLPTEMTFVSVTAPDGWMAITPNIGSGGTVTFAKSTLSNQSVVTFSVVAKVIPTMPTGTIITSAVGVAATTDDPVNDNDSDTFEVAVGTVNPTAVQLTTDAVRNQQNGLHDLTVYVTNTTPRPINGFRVRVDFASYLAAYPSLRLYNATSAAGSSDVYVDYPYPVAVDGVVPVGLSFYSSTRTFPSPFTPNFSVEILPTSAASHLNAAGAQPRIVMMPSSNILLEFPSEPGRWYRVSYSHNLTDWFDSPVPIQASTNRMQWIDSGAPFTVSPPSSVASRYYRVNEIMVAPAAP